MGEYWKSQFDFIGLSTEEKPTDKAVNGTTFYEVDTSKFYIFYKGTWYEQGVEDDGTDETDETSESEE